MMEASTLVVWPVVRVSGADLQYSQSSLHLDITLVNLQPMKVADMHIRACTILVYINKLSQATREIQYVNKHLDYSASSLGLFSGSAALSCVRSLQLAKGPTAYIGHHPAEQPKITSLK